MKENFEFYETKIMNNDSQGVVSLTNIERQTFNEQLNKICGLSLYDVKKVTGWSDKIIDSLSWEIGECNNFFNGTEFSGWPVTDLPIQKKPFIKIDGVSYCFDYYNLFDNIYRVIQKDIKKHDSKYSDQWAKLQQNASEVLVEKLFKKLLPNCESYIGNYYPVGKTLKQMDENDVIVLFDDNLIIAEVKAGSFTYTPAITDLDAHKKSFDALINKANYQCERTLNYYSKCENEVCFYEENKHKKFTIRKEKIENIFTFCITVDNFNSFEAKIEKNHFFDINSGTIAISIDDFEVYAEYFDSPLNFLHYLKHRKEATRIRSLLLSDELDHLGMYIFRNSYDQFSDMATEATSITAIGFREDLDKYFSVLHLKNLTHQKPRQDIPLKINEIIFLLEKKKYQGRTTFSNALLDLPFEQRHELNDLILEVLQKQMICQRTLPLFEKGNDLIIMFISQDGYPFIDKEKMSSYTRDAMYKNNASVCWEVVLKYNYDQRLYDIEYRFIKLGI